MDAYSLVILPLLYLQLNFISINEFNTKEVDFTDNFLVAGIKYQRILEPIYSNQPKILLLSKSINLT